MSQRRADSDRPADRAPAGFDGCRVGFDVGGTFTDFVVQAPDGCPHIGKRLTSYPDPSEACLAGRDDVLARAGCPWPALGQAVHGTTLGSNLVLERKRRGAALLTTQGFRDVLIVARENRYQVHDLQIDRPAPLIPRRLQALGIPRVILPAAGVTAALGLLAAELRFDVARTHVPRLDDVDPRYVGRMHADMEAQAADMVRGAAREDALSVRRSADCRYLGQGDELSVPVPSGRLGPAAIEQVRRAFDEAYAQRYGYGSPGEAVEAVTWKVAAVGAGPRLQLPRIQDRGGLEPARKGRRPVYFPEKGGYVDTPVFGRDALSPGAELRGPAVIEERESTTVLPPGCGARVDGYRSLLVEVAAAH